MKKLLIALAILVFAVAAHAEVIATWTFPVSSLATAAADSQDANFDATLVLERGAGAIATTGGGFRTTGFGNDGINVANTDYFQIVMQAASGFELSLNGISGAFIGTASYSSGTGVSHQWAYSIDGGAFSLIDSAVTRIGNGTSDFDFTGTAGLQSVTGEVTLRYYASGNTTTGGWGFNSGGFTVDGALASAAPIPEPATMGLLGLGALAMVLRRKIRK
jgi:trimeric autotransporter adhesin